MSGRSRVASLALALVVSACSQLACSPAAPSRSARSLLEIYDRDLDNARTYLPSLVAVPGILGSQIVDPSDGRMYWGAALGRAPRPTKKPADARKLALPMALGVPISQLEDELEAGAILSTVQVELATGPMQVRAYPGVFLGLTEHLLANEIATNNKLAANPKQLAESGWATPFRGFAYDWRREISTQVEALDLAVRAAAARRQRGGAGMRTDLVAHSMGALVVRYYLRYGTQLLPEDGSLPELTWAGAARVDHAILVAPPNTGSATVFENLVNGKVVSSVLPLYPAALVGTFPGLFELLPRPRHATVIFADDHEVVDIYSIELWRKYSWGMLADAQDEQLSWLLPEVETREERLEIADEHLQKSLRCAEQFHRALDLPAEPPPHLTIHLFASDERRTPDRFVVARDTGVVSMLDESLGDGSVTRASALGDERQGQQGTKGGRLVSPIAWSSVHWGSGDHLGLTANIDFIDNLLYIVLESPRE